jgi:hypothetical protein
VTINWKMAAIAAAACFFLSFVTGLFARVHFLDLLLRALFMGLLGGGLAIALRMLVLRFLPELTESSSGAGKAPVAETGGNVDIVVADESGANAESGETAARTDGQAATLEEVVSAGSEEGEGGDFAEELEELKASPILSSRGEESEERYQPVKPPDVIEDVDVLPDLESFSDAFAVQELSGEAGSDTAPESMPVHSGSSSSSSRGNVMTDTETITQAIRTALHRDKKG